MLRASFFTTFKTPRLSFFSITKISFALAYGTIFPLLGPFTNKCLWLSKHNKGKVNKYTEFDGDYSCIPSTSKLSYVEDWSYTYLILQFFMFSWLPWGNPASLSAHVSVSCLWKYHSLIVLSTSLHAAWVYSGYTKASGLKIIWGRRAGESVEQSRTIRAWLTYSKVQKATPLLAAASIILPREIPRIYSSEKHIFG